MTISFPYPTRTRPMFFHRLWGLAGIVLLFSLSMGFAERPPIQVLSEEVRWRAAPPTMPAGVQVAVLEGDPKKRGLFTLRLKIPAGTRLSPHWHPRDERVTVLAGAAAVGFGNDFDLSRSRRFPAGSYYVNPPRILHFVHFPEDTVLQVTGLGPWKVRFLSPHPADR